MTSCSDIDGGSDVVTRGTIRSDVIRRLALIVNSQIKRAFFPEDGIGVDLFKILMRI